jgi:ABC-type transporter Mla MlaB component
MAAPVPTRVVLDVSALAPDAVTIDALARLQLTARRVGQRLELHDASDQLRELIAFAGLSDVLRVEPCR